VVCLTRQGSYLGFDAKKVGERIVDTERGLSIIPGKIRPFKLGYRLICSTDGESIILTVKLKKPVDWKNISNIMLKIEIYPKEYAYKTYRGGDIAGYFHERYMGKMMLIPSASEISVAPEDDLRAFTVTSEDSGLSLIDGRSRENFSGFIVIANLPPNSSKQQFSMKITPRVNPDWRREPVIQVSQVGYHPMQKKMAVLELDSRIQEIENMKLFLSCPVKNCKHLIAFEEKPDNSLIEYLEVYNQFEKHLLLEHTLNDVIRALWSLTIYAEFEEKEE